MDWDSKNRKWHIRLQPWFRQGAGTPKGIGTFSDQFFQVMIHDVQHRKPRYFAFCSFGGADQPTCHANAAREKHVPSYVADRLKTMCEEYRNERNHAR